MDLNGRPNSGLGYSVEDMELPLGIIAASVYEKVNNHSVFECLKRVAGTGRKTVLP
jgi:hypothetical protein